MRFRQGLSRLARARSAAFDRPLTDELLSCHLLPDQPCEVKRDLAIVWALFGRQSVMVGADDFYSYLVTLCHHYRMLQIKERFEL